MRPHVSAVPRHCFNDPYATCTLLMFKQDIIIVIARQQSFILDTHTTRLCKGFLNSSKAKAITRIVGVDVIQSLLVKEVAITWNYVSIAPHPHPVLLGKYPKIWKSVSLVLNFKQMTLYLSAYYSGFNVESVTSQNIVRYWAIVHATVHSEHCYI